jgi:hypothetical protein
VASIKVQASDAVHGVGVAVQVQQLGPQVALHWLKRPR